MTQSIRRRWGTSPSPLATEQTNHCRQSEDNYAFHWCFVSKLFVAPPSSDVLLVHHVYGSHYGLICTIKAFNQLTVFQPVHPAPNPQNSSLINCINNSRQHLQHNFPGGNNFTQINSRRGRILICSLTRRRKCRRWWLLMVDFCGRSTNTDSAELCATWLTVYTGALGTDQFWNRFWKENTLPTSGLAWRRSL